MVILVPSVAVGTMEITTVIQTANHFLSAIELLTATKLDDMISSAARPLASNQPGE